MEKLEERIKKLSPEDKKTFDLLETLQRDKIKIMNREVIARAEDRYWCENNRINYANPDMLQIAIYAYRELAGKGEI